MYDCEPEEYVTACTMPLWPVSLAMGLVGKADMFAGFARYRVYSGHSEVFFYLLKKLLDARGCKTVRIE